jgi:predicted NUDIX family NTP pyrophosphohydrolase
VTASGKTVHAWLIEADLDAAEIVSNTFEIEWPPRSGRRQTYPEVDRAGWFDAATAAVKIHKGQRPILAEAIERLAARR